jgi:hypothetical protein
MRFTVQFENKETTTNSITQIEDNEEQRVGKS